MSYASRRILHTTLFSSLFTGVLLVTTINACSKSTLSSSKSLDLQFTFSPASGTTFSADSLVSVIVIDPAPNCEDLSGGQGLFFADHASTNVL